MKTEITVRVMEKEITARDTINQGTNGRARKR